MRPDTSEKAHGHHTLKVHRGVVVGVHGDDVFVQLGPRAQGVISARKFPKPPREEDEFDFTLRGREESLWVLELAGDPTLPTWEEMEPGCLVPARVMRAVDGGLQLKIAHLHAFMPKSQCGLPRGKRITTLVGRSFTVEVLEVDREHQRVTVSRRAVLARERAEQRELARLVVGQVVQGRVTRIEDYGAFVSLGRGREGLIHISNLAHDPPAHPSDLLSIGDPVQAKVLHVKRGGRRIALGIKQLSGNPWQEIEREHYEGQLVRVTVRKLTDFGAFCRLRPGVEGLLPCSESGAGTHGLRALLHEGQEIAVRILGLDARRERLTLSLLHPTGARITLEELQADFDHSLLERGDERGPLVQNLGALLSRALSKGIPRAT